MEKEPQQSQAPPVRAYQPKIPYLARLKKDKEDAWFKKFWDILKQLHIYLPIVSLLSNAQVRKIHKGATH